MFKLSHKTSVTIESLLKEKNICVEVVEQDLKKDTGNGAWLEWYEHKFPRKIVISNLAPSTKGAIYLDYFNGEAIIITLVPIGFKVIITEDKEMEKSFLNFKLKDLASSLYFSHMVGNIPEIALENGSINRIETIPASCLSYQVDYVHNELRKAVKGDKLVAKTLLETKQKNKPIEVSNAYGLEKSKDEVDFTALNGPMHFGVGKIEEKEALRMVKALDAILGVASVSLFAKFDDKRRRLVSGLPGEYRMRKHGLEYRVLSNAWLFHPLAMNLVFDLGRKAICVGIETLLPFLWDATEKETVECIMHSDVSQARKILTRNKDSMIKILETCYGKSSTLATCGEEEAFQVWMNGIDSVVENPLDIEGNWLLKGYWGTHNEATGKKWSKALAIIKAGKKVA